MNRPTLPPILLDLEHATDHCDVVLTNYTDKTAFKGCLVLGLVVSTYELGKHNPSSQSLSVHMPHHLPSYRRKPHNNNAYSG